MGRKLPHLTNLVNDNKKREREVKRESERIEKMREIREKKNRK